MGCSNTKRFPVEPEEHISPHFEAVPIKLASQKARHYHYSLWNTEGDIGGDINSSTSTEATESEIGVPDKPKGEQTKPSQPAEGAAPRRHSHRRPTGEVVAGRAKEGKSETLFKKKKRRGDWRQARKPFLSDLPEVDADIPYRINMVVLGMAANQVIQSACGSDSAQSLVAKPSPESKGTGGDFLSDVFSAAAKVGALKQDVQEISMDVVHQTSSKDDRCLCQVNSSRVGNKQLAKLAFTHVRPGSDLPLCATPFEALSTIMVITLVVGGPALGEDPTGAIQDQLRALAELVGLLRVRTPTKLRPVRAVLLCSLDEEGRPAHLDHNGEWLELLEGFEEEHGHLWKFGPVCTSDKESVHATFSQMTSARVFAPELCKGAPGAGTKEPDQGEAAQQLGHFSSEASQTVHFGREVSGSSREACLNSPIAEVDDSSSEAGMGDTDSSMTMALWQEKPTEVEEPCVRRRSSHKEILPPLTGVSPSLPSSKTSTDLTADSAFTDRAFSDIRSEEAMQLSSLLDRADAAQDGQMAFD